MVIYGNPLMKSKREANSKVVRLLLRPAGNSQSFLHQKKARSGQRLGVFRPLLCPVVASRKPTLPWTLSQRPWGYRCDPRVGLFPSLHERPWHPPPFAHGSAELSFPCACFCFVILTSRETGGGTKSQWIDPLLFCGTAVTSLICQVRVVRVNGPSTYYRIQPLQESPASCAVQPSLMVTLRRAWQR